MTEILNLFTNDPLSTYVGLKIEAATSPNLQQDDWALNLEICDIINENDDDAKDAARAIRKRLQQIDRDKNFATTNWTLTVLETCVSNCSRRFHVQVMTKDFIQDLVKLIGPKNNPPIELQERVLRLIERWAEAFKDQPDLAGVVTVYNELKAKGVTFPTRDPSLDVPIRTPHRTIPSPSPVAAPGFDRSSGDTLVGSQRHQRPVMNVAPSGPVVLEGEGHSKISQDLVVVQSSIEMFTDIMQAIESKNQETEWKLAADLNSTCRQMKDRIVDLIERVANEDLTIEMLRLNDELNNIFTKYDRLVKNRPKTTTPKANVVAEATNPQTSTVRPTTRTENELSLIDFNADESSTASQVLNPALTSPDPFDSSAVTKALEKTATAHKDQPSSSRQFESLASEISKVDLGADKKTSSGQNANLPEEISSVREQDFAEIENWLSTDSGRNLDSIAQDLPSIEPVSIPNTEFDNFIASRALAGSTSTRQSQAEPKPSKNPEPSM